MLYWSQVAPDAERATDDLIVPKGGLSCGHPGDSDCSHAGTSPTDALIKVISRSEIQLHWHLKLTANSSHYNHWPRPVRLPPGVHVSVKPLCHAGTPCCIVVIGYVCNKSFS